MTREITLLQDHIFSMFRKQYEGEYDMIVDHNLSGKATLVSRKDPAQTISPLPWENAPKADGSTDEFRREVERCYKFMRQFAMHTPRYFLKNSSGAESTTPQAPKKATAKAVKKTTNAGKQKRPGKRKAPDVDDEEGWFSSESSRVRQC